MVRRLGSALVVGFALLVAAACGEGTPDAGGSLIDHREWSLVGADQDPFGDALSTPLPCDSLAFAPEDLDGTTALFVSTESCNLLTVQQPALRAVAAGARVTVDLYHYELTAAEPVEGHLALAFGDAVVWERTVSIPAQEAAIVASFTSEVALAAGEPLLFHVHNHGENEWVLIDVRVEAPE